MALPYEYRLYPPYGGVRRWEAADRQRRQQMLNDEEEALRMAGKFRGVAKIWDASSNAYRYINATDLVPGRTMKVPFHSGMAITTTSTRIDPADSLRYEWISKTIDEVRMPANKNHKRREADVQHIIGYFYKRK